MLPPLMSSSAYISVLEGRGVFKGEDADIERTKRLETFFNDHDTVAPGSQTLQTYLDAFASQKKAAMGAKESDTVLHRTRRFDFIARFR